MARKAIARTNEAIEMDNGEVLHGWFREVRMVKASGDRDAFLYDFELIDALGDYPKGKSVSLWGSTILDDLLGRAFLNVETWVSFQGVKGRTKIYKVEQDEDRTDGEKKQPAPF